MQMTFTQGYRKLQNATDAVNFWLDLSYRGQNRLLWSENCGQKSGKKMLVQQNLGQKYGIYKTFGP